MYFPFLRGKMNELLALRECVIKLSESGKVVPIIEPVTKGFLPIIKCIKTLCERSVEHIIIYNSKNGEIGKSPELTSRLIEEIKTQTEAQHFAFILNSSTKADEINEFMKNIGQRKYSFIHDAPFHDPKFLFGISRNPRFGHHILMDSSLSRSYKEKFGNFSRVNVSDCFRSVNRNAEYANPDNEFYTDAHLTYKSDGFTGFGDYTTLSGHFKSGGFQPYTASLHLTYEVGEMNEVWVRHFISEVYDYPISDQAALIHEALPEMIAFITEHNNYFRFSESVKEIEEIHKEGRSTNLGYMKKLAIKHHIELLLKIV